jgi:hypothetical protein
MLYALLLEIQNYQFSEKEESRTKSKTDRKKGLTEFINAANTTIIEAFVKVFQISFCLSD